MKEIYSYLDYFKDRLSTREETVSDGEDAYNREMLPRLDIYQEFARQLPQTLLQLPLQYPGIQPVPANLQMPSAMFQLHQQNLLMAAYQIAGIATNKWLQSSTAGPSIPLKKRSAFESSQEPEEKRSRTEDDEFLLPLLFPRPKPVNLLSIGSRCWGMMMKKVGASL